ncbi:MAG TPA: UDP-N-acetylmuramoylalanyl-D-glutamyl-2,6-diaminopimelate--D-alanyl-D-alanine ligase [Magnetospirillaceae bacterium]|jgi:UDP-N-acetylmuramoyl-tripeptide--D-alanyl-D-alanine ligase
MTAMPLWTRAEILAATHAQASGGDWQATGVSIDSRSVNPGDLFVALSGPNHDGHDYVAAAFAKGGAAAIVQRVPNDVSAGAPLIIAADTQAALNDLAAAARARSGAKIVAVTGSVGKTGTKEMLKLAFDSVGLTHATQGNLNNRWGVPLSLARLPREAQYAVFELGMNHAGEITPLTRMVRPHVAIITTVEPAHLEFFASTAEIAAAKAEIMLGLDADGTAVLPRDNRHYAQLEEAARAAGVTHIESFGHHIDSTARLLDAAVDPNETLVFALLGDQPIGYRVGAAGLHWANNSLAVLLAARAAGVSPDVASKALATMSAPKGRGARQTLAWRDGQIEVIDDSYNASPASMRAAIAVLAAGKAGKHGRRVAIVGDMLELGDTSPQLHAGLADALNEWRIDMVITAGPLMRHLHDALPEARRGGHGANSEEAATLAMNALRAGDLVMVKGSAGSRMGRVVKALEEAATNRAGQEG